MQHRNWPLIIAFTGLVALAGSVIPARHARGSDVLASQYDGSQEGTAHSSFNNGTGNIVAGTQSFVAATSGTLTAIEVFTGNFGSASKYPDTNDCYLTLSDAATGALLATSDNRYHGYGCGGDLRFSFRSAAPHLAEGSSYRWSYVFGSQNRSSITFFGTATDTIGGSFTVAPLADARFTAYAAPAPPSSLALFDAFGAVPLTTGSIDDHSIVKFSAALPSLATDTLTLQVEIEPSFVPFRNIPNMSSSPLSVGNGSVTATTASTTLTNGAYHWQARTADTEGNTSAWVAPDQEDSRADFFVEDLSTSTFIQDNDTAYTLAAEPAPCGDQGPFACALTPKAMNYMIPVPFRISSATFDWKNDGSGNNCDGLGTYGIVITSSSDPSTIIATSTDPVYLGCARGTSGTATLSFPRVTIPEGNFFVTLSAFDGGLQGGSLITVSHLALHGVPDDGTAASTSAASSTPTSTPDTGTSPGDGADPASGYRRPIVIVPGILGSYLTTSDDGYEVWPHANAMIASSSDAYLNTLKLSPEGTEKGVALVAPDIIRTVTSSIPYAHVDVYGPLIDMLTKEGWREGIDLFVAPYDWRFGAAHSAAAIAPVIQEARAHSADGTIAIIAHSMGGLVTKEYLATATDTTFVKPLLLIGTPQLGAPEMFGALEFGDDLGFRIGPFPLLDPKEVQSIAQNMPSTYELLPSRRYVAIQGGYVIDNRNGGHTILDFDGTNALMESTSTGEGARNAGLLMSADALHAMRDMESIQGSAVYALIGCQDPATPTAFVLQDDGTTHIVHGGGDGTVPTVSAFNLAHDDRTTYFSLYSENGADHRGLIADTGPLTLIEALLENTTSSLDLAPLGISTSTEDCLEGRAASPHPETTIEADVSGPATVDVIDAIGTHTNAEETNIPGSRYGTTNGGEFLMLPAGAPYRMEFHAKRQGSFTLVLRTFDDAARSTGAATYIDVPLASPSTTASLAIASSSEAPLLILTNQGGTGSSTRSIAPTAILSTDASDDVTPPVITIAPIPASARTGTPLVLSFSVADEGSGVATTTAVLDGTPIASDTTIATLVPGSHTVTVHATDNAGNPRTETRSFTIESSTEVSSTSPSTTGGITVSVPGIPIRHCKPRPHVN